MAQTTLERPPGQQKAIPPPHSPAGSTLPLLVETGAPYRWKFTDLDLRRLEDEGILPADRKFELLDGEVFQIMPANPLHSAIVGIIARLMDRAVPDGYCVRHEAGIRLGPHYLPHPDVAIVSGRNRDYKTRFPNTAEVYLVVEVADSSVAFDRAAKHATYAGAGLPEYWIVNLVEQHVEVHRTPADGRYQEITKHLAGDSLTPVGVTGVVFTVSDLLDVE